MWKFRARGSAFCVDWSGFGYSGLRIGGRNSIEDAVVVGLDLVQARMLVAPVIEIFRLQRRPSGAQRLSGP